MFKHFRRFWLNLRPNIAIGPKSRIAKSATLDISGGGAIKLGRSCHVRQHVIIASYGGRILIGDNVSINPFCVLYGHGGLTIGSDVLIAAHVVMIPANHRFDDLCHPIRLQGETRNGIRIEDNVWIGAGARNLDGVCIGTGSIVAAGAVVTNDVPAGVIVGGIPARILKHRRHMPLTLPST